MSRTFSTTGRNPLHLAKSAKSGGRPDARKPTFVGWDWDGESRPIPGLSVGPLVELKDGLTLEQARTVAWLRGRIELLQEIAAAHLPGDEA